MMINVRSLEFGPEKSILNLTSFSCKRAFSTVRSNIKNTQQVYTSDSLIFGKDTRAVPPTPAAQTHSSDLLTVQ